MQPVKITIDSHAKGLNADDCLQTVCFGQMTERDGKFYVVYEETSATGLEGTKTTIKWDNERIIILRHGKLEHRQEFGLGFIDNSLYKTPYMDIPVVARTNNIAIASEDGVWMLCVEYSSEIGGEAPSEIRLKIVIEEENKGEH
ncbi:MAG: DUF1934 domain-containing protein [Acidaminococcaceae bacterium]